MAPPSAMPDTSNYFVKNHLWPVLMGLTAALTTALTTELPVVVLDGLQGSDWTKLGGTVTAAGVGYLANILSRYGGKTADWVQPPVQPDERV